MKVLHRLGTGLVAGTVLWMAALSSRAAESPEQYARQAYGMLLAQLDANKDGKLSMTECKAMWKDKGVADKNCGFWDADKDGFITEAEYVKQGLSQGKKK